MDKQQQTWQRWANQLHSWGASGIVASFLEAAGPFRLFAAQAAYLGQPLLQPWVTQSDFESLVSVFEDDQQADSFINILREGE